MDNNRNLITKTWKTYHSYLHWGANNPHGEDGQEGPAREGVTNTLISDRYRSRDQTFR